MMSDVDKTTKELLKEDIINALQHTRKVAKMARQILSSNHFTIHHLEDATYHLEDALESFEENYTMGH